jgi:hypothetical protein
MLARYTSFCGLVALLCEFLPSNTLIGKLYGLANVVSSGLTLYLASLFRQLLLRDFPPDDAQLIG